MRSDSCDSSQDKVCRQLTTETFAVSDINNLLEKFEHLYILITDSLSPSVLNKILMCKKYLGKIEFIIECKKDFKFIKIFRSFPFFARDSLYLKFNFKDSLSGDFFEAREISEIYTDLENKVGQGKVRFFQAEEIQQILNSYQRSLGNEQVSIAPKGSRRTNKERIISPLAMKSKTSTFFFRMSLLLSRCGRFVIRLGGALRRQFSYLGIYSRRWVIRVHSFYKIYIEWRFSPVHYKGYLFSASYPLRKVYYFIRFQYKKRILNFRRRRSNKGEL